jgi:hypothetical protein
MFPGTQAFMRWELPSRLPATVQQRALEVAQRFLQAIGFDQGCFNMEFFHDPASDRLTVIEFNPRLASQFSDLYLRVTGLDPHALSLALARGEGADAVARVAPKAGAAASLVYRTFPGDARPAMPGVRQRDTLLKAFPDGLVFTYPRPASAVERDFKWLGSWRHGILHLGARDAAELRERALRASALLGWRAPYADQLQAEAEAVAHWEPTPLTTHATPTGGS